MIAHDSFFIPVLFVFSTRAMPLRARLCRRGMHGLSRKKIVGCLAFRPALFFGIFFGSWGEDVLVCDWLLFAVCVHMTQRREVF